MLGVGVSAVLVPVAASSAGSATPVSAAHGPSADTGTLDGYDPWPNRPTFRPARANPLTSPGKFKGVDGKMHSHSPILVGGRNGTKYFGEELDGACGYGRQFGKSLNRLRKLARVIEQSGRLVVYTVPPSKSAVNKQDLRLKRLPHGKCDVIGIKRQDRTLDTFQDRNYLGMRKQLANAAAAGQKHLYWPIDTHWTKLSSVQYVQALAKRLDPTLAKRQTYRRGKEKIETDLSFLGIIPRTREIGPALFPTTPVRVQPVPGSVAYDPSVVISPEHEWRTKPGRLTWPGRTLLVGDSFTYRGLDGLMPLFGHGQFLWIGQPGVPSVVDAIPQADTVVLEVVQRWLPISPLTSKSFKIRVRRALAAYDEARWDKVQTPSMRGGRGTAR